MDSVSAPESRFYHFLSFPFLNSSPSGRSFHFFPTTIKTLKTDFTFLDNYKLIRTDVFTYIETKKVTIQK